MAFDFALNVFERLVAFELRDSRVNGDAVRGGAGFDYLGIGGNAD